MSIKMKTHLVNHKMGFHFDLKQLHNLKLMDVAI